MMIARLSPQTELHKKLGRAVDLLPRSVSAAFLGRTGLLDMPMDNTF